MTTSNMQQKTGIDEAKLINRTAEIGTTMNKASIILNNLHEYEFPIHWDSIDELEYNGLLDILSDYITKSQELLKSLHDDIWNGGMSA